jgi:glycosyltransferase involved in cell wall biosynthesis
MNLATNETPALLHTAVIIPALNEAENLAELLPRLEKLGLGQIIVVDNGSTDATADVARKHGVTTAHEPKRGYGAACQTGIAALHDDADTVAFMDADLSDDPDCLPTLVEPLSAGLADLAIGWRAPHLRDAGALTPPQIFGNRLATALIRLGWSARYRDLGPFRAATRRALARMDLRDRAFGWTVEMQIRAAECGLRVLEIPVPYRPRTSGKSKISGTIRGTFQAGYWILRTIGALWLTKHRRRRLPGA